MPTRASARRARRPMPHGAAIRSRPFPRLVPRDVSSHPGIRRALEYLGEHYAEDVSLAQAARHAHLSKYHFSRLFRELVGLTYQDYLTELRVCRAKTLLAESRYRSVTSIGYEVGLGSLRNFEVHFKRTVGLTPSEYRECSSKGNGVSAGLAAF